MRSFLVSAAVAVPSALLAFLLGSAFGAWGITAFVLLYLGAWGIAGWRLRVARQRVADAFVRLADPRALSDLRALGAELESQAPESDADRSWEDDD